VEAHDVPMFNTLHLSRTIRTVAVTAALALTAVACGGGVPSRSELLKALDEAGLDKATSECVADDLDGKDDLLKSVASGKQEPEVVEVIAQCMLDGGDVSIDDESGSGNAGTTEETVPPTETAAPADATVAGGNDAAGADADAALIETWTSADAKLFGAEAGEYCKIGDALTTWGTTDYPTTLHGASILNIFEMSIITSTQALMSDQLSPELSAKLDTATSALADAALNTDVAAFLAADKAAFAEVQGDIIAAVAAAGC
jgi:hypothetical protein